MKRGDIAIMAFPYADGQRGKNRPALIVQNDRDNQRLSNTVVAMISGNIRHVGEPAQVLIDPEDEVGASSGLHGPSVVKCGNLFTVRKQDIERFIGHLSAPLQSEVDRALKSALGLS